MSIYVYKASNKVSTNAVRNGKAVKAIYVKEQGKDFACVWGNNIGQIPFYYPASPECPSIYTVDKIKATTNERETLFTNPQEAGVMLVNPGDTLKIRFYSQWYQNSGSKIKQENQTEYVLNENSSEEYSFVVQSGQGAVRLETILGEEKSASCTITAPSKTWGRGINSFAINVISRKGVASSHTINENKTISLNYGDQVNIADIVYPNEGYNQPIILLENGFANNRVERLSLSVSVNRNPKEYSVVKQFTGQNVAWAASNMIADNVYYDDEISFKVVRKAGYDSPTVNITNGSGGATITTVPHSKDSSVINEINVSLVVKGALAVTVQGGSKVAQTTVTLNVTMTEHIHNAEVIVYNIYNNTSTDLTVTTGNYTIPGNAVVEVIKTIRETGYKPIYVNNQKSPITGSLLLDISEEKGIPLTLQTEFNNYSDTDLSDREVAVILGDEDSFRATDEVLAWGQSYTIYKGECVTTKRRSSDLEYPSYRRPPLIQIRDTDANVLLTSYYCADTEKHWNNIACFRQTAQINTNAKIVGTIQPRQEIYRDSIETSILRGVTTNYIAYTDYIDAVGGEVHCSFTDRKGNTQQATYGLYYEQSAKKLTLEGKSILGATGVGVKYHIRMLQNAQEPLSIAAHAETDLVDQVYVKGKVYLRISAYV